MKSLYFLKDNRMIGVFRFILFSPINVESVGGYLFVR